MKTLKNILVFGILGIYAILYLIGICAAISTQDIPLIVMTFSCIAFVAGLVIGRKLTDIEVRSRQLLLERIRNRQG